MNATLENVITEGKDLLRKVRAHYSSSPETLSSDQLVTVAELESWYSGVEALLERVFGLDSKQLHVWHERRAEAQKRSWDAVWNGDSPQGESFAVEQLADSIGILAEIKIFSIGTESIPEDSIGLGSLHPAVAKRCRGLFTAQAYDEAVFSAFKAVEEEVRCRSGAAATDIGVQLVSKAMGGKSPSLQLSTIAPEQEALHSLFRGAIGAFKNPLSHRSLNHSNPEQVMELLAFASLLMRILEDARRTQAVSADR